MNDFPFACETVKAIFESFPPEARTALLTIRSWIFEISAERADVGTIIEELKWGQPSYATRPKTGCPVRLGSLKDGSDCALYVPCQSSLISVLRDHYASALPANFSFSGKRAILFTPGFPLPEAELRHAITLALTYYSCKKK